MSTIQQQRAAHALTQVNHVIGRGDAGDFKGCAKGIGSMIQANGLGAALAFHQSRTEEAPRLVASAIGMWLCSEGRPLHSHAAGDCDVLEAIVQCSLDEYLAAQAEALAYSVWLKMFAMALVEAPPRGAGGRG